MGHRKESVLPSCLTKTTTCGRFCKRSCMYGSWARTPLLDLDVAALWIAIRTKMTQKMDPRTDHVVSPAHDGHDFLEHLDLKASPVHWVLYALTIHSRRPFGHTHRDFLSSWKKRNASCIWDRCNGHAILCSRQHQAREKAQHSTRPCHGETAGGDSISRRLADIRVYNKEKYNSKGSVFGNSVYD